MDEYSTGVKSLYGILRDTSHTCGISLVNDQTQQMLILRSQHCPMERLR